MESRVKPSLLCHVSCLFVLTTQLFTLVTAKEFLVFGPSDPIVAAPGGEAILPCSVLPAMNVENMQELRWFRTRFSEAVLVYRDQEEHWEEQMPGYSQRTSLVKDQFHQGKAAVRIQNVQASDSGIYICHFKQGVFYEEAILELKVAVMGTVPKVYTKVLEDCGVCVVCMTSGWYPEPQVHWRNSRGENLPAFSEAHTKDAEGLFSTETSLVVRDSSVRNVTCSIFNPILGQEKATAIFIPEPFFPQASPWKPAFFVILTMMGLVVLGTGYLLKREHCARLKVQRKWGTFWREKDELLKTKEDALRTTCTFMEELDQSEAAYNADAAILQQKVTQDDWRDDSKVKSTVCTSREPEYNSQQSHDWHKDHFQEWTFTLDPASAHPILVISEDRMGVTRKDPTMCLDGLFSVLGSKGISSGRYYWEVKLRNREGSQWILGVCKKGVDRNNFHFESPEKGLWTLGSSNNGYWAYINSGKMSLSTRQNPEIVGVFVDYTEGDISFYNMSDMSHIFSFHETFLFGTLFPYFRIESGNVSMTISSMAGVSEQEEREEEKGEKGKEEKEEEEGEQQEECKEGEDSLLLQHA